MVGKNRVVITGLGVLAANGIGKDAFWNTLLAGESGIGPITQFDASDIPWKIAGEVKDFDPENYIDKNLKPRRQSRNTQFAAAATSMALDDANLTVRHLEKAAPVLITLGISLGGMDLLEQHTRRIIDKGMIRAMPSAASCVHVIASSFVSAMLGVPASINVISNSCTGGLDAIASGANAIRKGETEIAIVGGTDAVIIPSVISGLGAAGMLTSVENPIGACQPFDLNRSGGVASEGCAVVILENLDHALKRGADFYTEILGHGSASSMNTNVTDGLRSCMGKAINNSGCLPKEIAYINAHGPGDQDLDYAETLAIKNVFNEYAYSIPVTSIKGAIGNPMAAGGAIQAVACALAMKKGILPPTTNYKTQDPSCDLDYVPASPRMMNIPLAMINSHGTGGVNSSLVMRKT